MLNWGSFNIFEANRQLVATIDELQAAAGGDGAYLPSPLHRLVPNGRQLPQPPAGVAPVLSTEALADDSLGTVWRHEHDTTDVAGDLGGGVGAEMLVAIGMACLEAVDAFEPRHGADPTAASPAADSSGTAKSAPPVVDGGAGLDRRVCRRFIVAIASLYRPNPYHSALHAADMTSAVTYLLVRAGFRRRFDAVSAATIVLAAICHDVGHPGFNNQFLGAVRDPLALLFPQGSILERMHACVSASIMTELEGCDPLAAVQRRSPREAARARLLFANVVHGTDPSKHFAHLDELRRLCITEAAAAASAGGPASPPPAFEPGSNAETIVAQMVVHAGDISNPCRPWPLACCWQDVLGLEFGEQTLAAREAGVEVNVLFEPEAPQFKAGLTRGFGLVVLMPLIEQLAGMQGVELEPMLSTLRGNLARCERLVAEQKRKDEEEEGEEEVVGGGAVAREKEEEEAEEEG